MIEVNSYQCCGLSFKTKEEAEIYCMFHGGGFSDGVRESAEAPRHQLVWAEDGSGNLVPVQTFGLPSKDYQLYRSEEGLLPKVSNLNTSLTTSDVRAMMYLRLVRWCPIGLKVWGGMEMKAERPVSYVVKGNYAEKIEFLQRVLGPNRAVGDASKSVEGSEEPRGNREEATAPRVKSYGNGDRRFRTREEAEIRAKALGLYPVVEYGEEPNSQLIWSERDGVENDGHPLRHSPSNTFYGSRDGLLPNRYHGWLDYTSTLLEEGKPLSFEKGVSSSEVEAPVSEERAQLLLTKDPVKEVEEEKSMSWLGAFGFLALLGLMGRGFDPVRKRIGVSGGSEVDSSGSLGVVEATTRGNTLRVER